MKAATIGICMAAVLAAGGTMAGQEKSTPTTSTVATQPSRAKIDLNTADIPTLEALPEIGTDFANAVVAGRPYKSVDDVARVVKLPAEKMATLRAKVFVSPPKAFASTPPDPLNNAPSKPPQTKDGKATPAQEVTERYDRAQSKAAAPRK